jgi:predicted O-methyltransferase YrrM
MTLGLPALNGLTRWYERREYHRGLHGCPDPVVTLPLTWIADRLRWGRLGRYIWQARRIAGWTRHAEAVALAHASHRLREDAVIVEIGSFLGCSAVLMAGARKLRGSGCVHCIDPFDASGDAFSVPVYRSIQRASGMALLDRFRRNVARARVGDWIRVHVGRAEDVVTWWNEPIDLLLLDGHQSYDDVRAAFEAWTPFLQPDGVLAIHNSRAGYREDTHDGSARLAETLVPGAGFEIIQRVGSMTFVFRRAPLGDAPAGPLP